MPRPEQYVLIDYVAAATTTVRTYTNIKANSLTIINDGASDITIAFGNFTITVKTGERFDLNFDGVSSITVTATTTAFRLFIYN